MTPASVSDWIGKAETTSDVVTATPYSALSATLDRDAQRPPAGTPLPPLWHWLYFLPLYQHRDLGPDGHAQKGGFLPPTPLPRRMWAGSQLAFGAPIRVGDSITRVSTIEAVTEKSGRTGPLVFVKVRHDIRRAGQTDIAIVEHHDIVYREAPKAGEVAPPPAQAPATSGWERAWVPDDVLLFRYSALTFNGHRIHYDRRYVTEVEGYPGLVVHGPLLATLMLDLLRHERPDAVVARYVFKALRPVFDIHTFHVCGQPQADGRAVDLWVRDHEGALAMSATASLA
jgi:3-methylfumaryl-CoA hydratase